MLQQPMREKFMLKKQMEKLPWWLVVGGSLTLGLAPFYPKPHLLEKLVLLSQGELTRAIDIFDLLLHGFFPALLFTKFAVTISTLRRS